MKQPSVLIDSMKLKRLQIFKLYLFKLGASIVVALVLSSCMLDAQIQPITSTTPSSGGGGSVVNPVLSSVTSDREFVPGATTMSLSNGRLYKKRSAAGLQQSHLTQNSTSRGYKIYMSVQGQVISDDISH